MQLQSSIYKRHCSPREVINHAVWIYYRLNPSLRDASQALSYKGLDINHESFRA